LGLGERPLYFVGHHQAHAACAFYTSTWERALVVTSDGKGGGLSGTISVGEGRTLSLKYASSDLDSPGNFYGAITRYLGYRANRHEGKITGLAAFGDSGENLAACGDLLAYDRAGKTLVNRLHRDHTICDAEKGDKLLEDALGRFFKLGHVGGIQSIVEAEGRLQQFRFGYVLFKHYFDEYLASREPADVAAFAQNLLEQVVVAQVKDALVDFPHKYVCLAGGTFANVRLNQLIREIEGVENIFVYPAMGDAGTAAGAGLQVAFDAMAGPEGVCRETIGTVYQGRGNSDDEIERVLKAQGYRYEYIEDIEEVLAGLLYEGQVVGRFDGPMEWGARGLGNRSILVRAVDRDINKWLNQRLHRTEFMPFAPSILAEHAGAYYKGYRDDHVAARFMTVTYDCHPEKIHGCPAVVHIDGTARPQVVFKEDNPGYHRLISAYYKRSGLPLIVNTSFNIHEEPIVCSPSDALRAFASGAVDVLAMGHYLVGSTVGVSGTEATGRSESKEEGVFI
ncbi:MAG: hypothetical protein K9M57_03625, partial [Phycisphaerae bacterium]|nr:hypothetical protein [Phycisphaerae bacterium]